MEVEVLIVAVQQGLKGQEGVRQVQGVDKVVRGEGPVVVLEDGKVGGEVGSGVLVLGAVHGAVGSGAGEQQQALGFQEFVGSG